MQKITIALADDHAVVAQGIANLLGQMSMVKTVHVFENGQLLYTWLESNTPHLVLLDIEMPQWDGLTTLKAIKEKNATLPCLMLSMNNEKFFIQACMKAGASGYLSKDCTPAELQEAIEVVLDGGTFLQPKIHSILVSKRTETSEYFELESEVTKRELEVLEHICDGMTCKEIAEKLFLSTRTVETHKKSIMQKFGAHSTGKLVSLAIKYKFVK